MNYLSRKSIRAAGTSLFIAIVCLVFAEGAFLIPAQAEERQQDHDALRALLKTSVEALNKGQLESIRPLALPDVIVTTAEQHRSSSFDDFKKYYESLFQGPGLRLASVTFQPVADDLTKFIDTNVGLVSGTSTDVYTFKNGDVKTMKSRWTSTLVKSGDQWKIASIQFGVNFMKNPVVDGLAVSAVKLAAACVLCGLLLGYLGGRVFSKKK